MPGQYTRLRTADGARFLCLAMGCGEEPCAGQSAAAENLADDPYDPSKPVLSRCGRANWPKRQTPSKGYDCRTFQSPPNRFLRRVAAAGQTLTPAQEDAPLRLRRGAPPSPARASTARSNFACIFARTASDIYSEPEGYFRKVFEYPEPAGRSGPGPHQSARSWPGASALDPTRLVLAERRPAARYAGLVTRELGV